MKRILFAGILFSGMLLNTACDKANVSDAKSESSEVKSNGLVVTLEGIFPKNDTYQLFYSNNDQFSEAKSLKIPVFGQTVMQKIVFIIPEKEKPENLRLDFGGNSDQTEVSIKNIELNYLGEKIDINNQDLYAKFFYNGQGAEYNVTKLTIDLSINADGVYDPFIVSTPEVKKSLNKLYNLKKVAK